MKLSPDLKPSDKLSNDEIRSNFVEMATPLSQNQAILEADRCYFCYDAPCTTACPTDIDVPEFIRRIKTGNTQGAAAKILEQNIMGAMCARVCPTEELCEQACVRNDHEAKPVEIGLLQRFATEETIQKKIPHFSRSADSGKKVAIIGAGPAGLACAHGLAVAGHEVCIFEKRSKAGGLNEYGIASYKALNNIAQKEVDYILSIGGITVEYGKALGDNLSLVDLEADYDAVFIGAGLGDVNALKLENEDASSIEDAVSYIAALRQSDDLSSLPVANRILVIGGGMTAIDIAVQSKMLGADDVTIVYRRAKEQMGASEHEQEYAQKHDVKLLYSLSPDQILTTDDHVRALRFQKTQTNENAKLVMLDKYTELPADIVFKAIGQKLLINNLDVRHGAIDMGKGRILVDEERKTSVNAIWAGGDCVADGQDLTVAAVQDGKIAAQSINAFLTTTAYNIL